MDDAVKDFLGILALCLVVLSIPFGNFVGLTINPQEYKDDKACYANIEADVIECIEHCATYNSWYWITENYCVYIRK
jgi:hypothetical protein